MRLPEASGGNGALSYTLAPPVRGLTFRPATRTLSGTPTVHGTYPMTYRADDADTNTAVTDAATLRFTITVLKPDTAPSFGNQTVDDQDYKTGETAYLRLPEATGGNPPLAYSLMPNVPGLEFLATARTLSGTPTVDGTYSMTYRVRDSDGDSEELLFTIEVGPAFVSVPSGAHCLQIEPGKPSDNYDTWTNICSEEISVFYCWVSHNPHFGTILCGENENERNPYYTHFSWTFGEADDTIEHAHWGSAYHYAVCLADINPYIEGEFVSDTEGRYSCALRQ